MRLDDLRLRTKFLVLLAIGLVAFGGVLFVGHSTFSTVKVGGPLYDRVIAGKDITADVLPPPLYVVETYLLAFEISSVEDPAQLDKMAKRFAALRDDYEKRHAYWTTNLEEGSLKAELLKASADPARAFFATFGDKYIPLLKDGKRDEALALARGQMKAQYEEHRASIDKVVELAGRYASDAESQAAATVSARLLTLGVIAGISLSATVLLGTIIARGISRPVSRMASTIRAAAESNDLTTRLDIRRRDEIGQLAGSTNTLLDRMQQLVGDVAKVAHDVAGAASQIAASAEEMSASVSEVARQAASATDAAAESGKVAQAGGQAVEQTIHGMQRIHEAVECGNRNVTDLGSKAEQIGKVIAVINDVAEQTNLLALNAAIEAARAGEHGRGFAVVADEVRKLAERTTRATEEVASSIQAIQSQTRTACDSMSAGTGQVREGVELAEKAGNNLREIVTRATSVAGMISSISAASQQAGAGATESATAATHLAAKANDLLGLVNFKLK